jgi:ATP-dependent DNA ligase
MRLRWVKEPFDDPDYIFELKHDGFRAVVYLQNGECKLMSRNSKMLRFGSLRNSLAKVPVHTAILDGEIVCLDEHGVSQFNQLFARKGEPVLSRRTVAAWKATSRSRLSPRSRLSSVRFAVTIPSSVSRNAKF